MDTARSTDHPGGVLSSLLRFDHAPVPEDPVKRRRTDRLRALPLIAFSYGADAAMLAAFAAAGAVPWLVPVLYLVSGLLLCGAFWLMLRGELPERFRDHHIVTEQVLAHCALLTAFAISVPQVGALLLMLNFVAYAFGALRMRYRSIVYGSIAVAGVLGLVVAFSGEQPSMPMKTLAQRLLSGLWFAMILARLAWIGQYSERLRGLLHRQKAQLTAALSEVERLASRDELTGAMNRRAIMGLVVEERERMHRTGIPFAVALFDIDYFKQVNDQHGHLVGDVVLRRFSDVAASALRATDRIGRFGGEEFLVLMPVTEHEESAVAATERIREAVVGGHLGTEDRKIEVTVSAGLALARDGESIEGLLGRADRALYAAKRDGRNCVRSA